MCLFRSRYNWTLYEEIETLFNAKNTVIKNVTIPELILTADTMYSSQKMYLYIDQWESVVA